jgi:general secretion pathway protein J
LLHPEGVLPSLGRPCTGAVATRRAASCGFTLIELLVALAVMALLALLSWRGLEGMSLVHGSVRARMDNVASLQTGLAQWSADLEAMVETPAIGTIDFDGRVLRLTRLDNQLPDRPLRVVGWARRVIADQHGGRGSWVRWQSPPLRNNGELQKAWEQAQLWGQSPGQGGGQREVAVIGLDQWQIFFFRNDAWSNPLSAAGADAEPADGAGSALPDAVRLVLTLSPGQALGGELSKDWVRPVLGGSKS